MNRFTNIYNAALKNNFNHEASVKLIYSMTLDLGGHAVDVGAHEGYHTFPLSNIVGDSGIVLAFEPCPDTREILRRKLITANIKNVCLHDSALSSYKGKSTFVKAVNRLSQSGLKQRIYSVPDVVPQIINVEVCCLDDFQSELKGRLDYIKIDVEGGEYDVLMGAMGVLSRFKPVVSFEWGASAYRAYGASSEKLFDLLCRMDYCILDILGNAMTGLADFIESDHTSGVFEYVAIPNGHGKKQSIQQNLQNTSRYLVDQNK